MSKNFISVNELQACYGQPEVVVIDCRFSLADIDLGERLYRQAHIPGAHYLHLDCNLSGARTEHGGRHPLPEQHVFEKCLQALGINNNSLIVAYDDSRFAFAARLWWLCRYFGHPQVKVLDGGLSAWLAAGLPVNAELPVATAGHITLREHPQQTVDIHRVRQFMHSESVSLIDSREPARYLGLEEPIDPRAGHIDSAINFPWQHVTDDEGFFTGAEQQRSRWAELAEKDLIVYCGSGVTACVNLLALSEIGRDDARLYPGSWSDWCSYT